MTNQLSLWSSPTPERPPRDHAPMPSPSLDTSAEGRTVASVWDMGNKWYIRFDAHRRNIKANAPKRNGKGGALKTPEGVKLNIHFDGQGALFIEGQAVGIFKPAPYGGEGTRPHAYVQGLGAYSSIEAWLTALGVNDEAE